MKRLALFLLLLTVSVAYAQDDRGSISGTVTDSTGAVVAKAAITITNEATNVPQSATSSDAGVYTVNYLIPGLYTVTASSPGFKQFSETHVRLEVGGRAGVDVKLAVGAQTEMVTVEGSGGA